jgi:hypothetical protein
MNESLIDCSFKSYSMASKSDRLIQRYAILIPRYAAYQGPALCGIARDHGPALCCIPQDHGPALCQHSKGPHILYKKIPHYVA